MANSQDIAKKIKEQAKEKGVSVNKMLTDCKIGVNTVGRLAKGMNVSTENLAKIADYLGVSVDYLLDRDKEKIAPMNRDDLAEILRNMSDEDLNKMYDYAKYLHSEREKQALLQKGPQE